MTADTRYEALQLAVQLHASSNVTKNAVPPKPETVVNTASVFDTFLETGRIEPHKMTATR